MMNYIMQTRDGYVVYAKDKELSNATLQHYVKQFIISEEERHPKRKCLGLGIGSRYELY